LATGPAKSERPWRSPLAYQPRRPVPWTVADVVTIVVFHFAVQVAILLLLSVALGHGLSQRAVEGSADRLNVEHPVIRLLREGGPWVLLLCIASTAIVAPIGEEFLFRVVFQGWLEAVERRQRRQVHGLRRAIGPAVGPILLSSLLFAGMHFRVNAPPLDTRSLILSILSGAAGNVLTVLFAVVLLRWRVGATAVDFGWVPERLRGDLSLGLATFAVVAVPIYAIQGYSPSVLPKGIAPDPVAIFFFAIVLGFVYYRTHRITPTVVVHAALNITTLLGALLLR
jgi:membrane protease YdiL (CAAX protease family)